MDTSFILRGLIIGFSIAAPVGPIGVLCIRRAIVKGRTCSLVSGLGAATADAIYGCIAGLGLTFVSDFLISQWMLFRLVGGSFLLYLGTRTLLSKPKYQQSGVSTGEKGLLSAYASTFLLTLTNPLTILSFAAIFAGLGIGGAGANYGSASLLVLGVFFGSSSWWLLLSSVVGSFASSLSRWVLWVNRISGISLIGFALVVFLGLA
jgi:threonine/homoserine/homoserine lactone efflux protein